MISLTGFVAVIVTVVWAAAVLAAIGLHFTIPLEVHAMMGLVCGSLFGKNAYDTAKQKAADERSGDA